MTLAKRIGKYPVIREIGKGAMGTVYEGFDPDTGEKDLAFEPAATPRLEPSAIDIATDPLPRPATC